MKLINAHVTDFRCVEDSTEFSLGDVTCLVGKNESGKTAVLQALEKVNSHDEKRRNFDKYKDYPRKKFTDFSPDTVALTTTWKLEPDDLAKVEAELCPKFLTTDQITLKKKYSGKTDWLFSWNEPLLITHLLKKAGCIGDDFATLKASKTITELHTKISELKGAPEVLAPAAIVTAAIEKYPSKNPASYALKLLDARIPKFLYFDNYTVMSGNVHLDTLKQHALVDKKTSASEDVFLAFLDFAGTSLEEVLKIERFEELKAKMEGASIKISQQIFKYWSQNKNLKVEFSLDAAKAGDPPPFNTGQIMHTRVLNKLHDMTVDFDNRSAGFVWFFSFLVLFSSVQKKYGNIIILLDEPGLNLHGKAQADLLRYIDIELKPKHQVVYTTHSPFMVPPANLASVRTVEDVVTRNDGDVQVLGTKVGDDVLSTDPDTLFPLQGALGYEITQTLFVGPNTLLVEGPSDLLYLQWASAQLIKRKRPGLDTRWVICPTGGVDKVSAFLSLFGGNKLNLTVLTDFASGQKGKVDSLKKSALLKAGRVFTAADFCDKAEADIEDILGDDVYLSIVNSAYNLTGKKQITKTTLSQTGEKSVRIVKQVEVAFRTVDSSQPFDHFFPAHWLITSEKVDANVDFALDNFAKLFDVLNPLVKG